MGDFWRDVKPILQEKGKVKRADNRTKSASYLHEANILFTVCNNGAHLIVEVKDCFIDFWPGTGKWIVRNNSGKSGIGVRNLVAYIKGEELTNV